VVFLGAHARRAYVRRELQAAEAEAATLMGQLVWDASQRRDHDSSVAFFDQAIRAARQRGDKPAEGFALLRKSFVALYGWRDPLGAADALFGQIQPDDPAIDLLSPTQPGRLAGSCYLFMHDAKTAVAILERTARELQDLSKSQPVVLGNLALAFIKEEAVTRPSPPCTRRSTSRSETGAGEA
jgi:hypothetical protein